MSVRDSIGMFSFITLPGGERHIKVDQSVVDQIPEGGMDLICNFLGSDDLVDLMLITNAAKGVRPDILSGCIYMPYFPYARQDRRAGKFEHNGVTMMISFLKMIGIKKLIISDPHSDAISIACDTAGIFLQVNTQNSLFSHMVNGARHLSREIMDTSQEGFVIVAPDQGAIKKASEIARSIPGCGFVFATKYRDAQSGALTFGGIVDTDGVLLTAKHIVVVDDICDGGGTFIGLIKELKKFVGAHCRFTLYVTHGIFSKGLVPLIDAGYTTFLSPYIRYGSIDDFEMSPHPDMSTTVFTIHESDGSTVYEIIPSARHSQ